MTTRLAHLSGDGLPGVAHRVVQASAARIPGLGDQGMESPLFASHLGRPAGHGNRVVEGPGRRQGTGDLTEGPGDAPAPDPWPIGSIR